MQLRHNRTPPSDALATLATLAKVAAAANSVVAEAGYPAPPPLPRHSMHSVQNEDSIPVTLDDGNNDDGNDGSNLQLKNTTSDLPVSATDTSAPTLLTAAAATSAASVVAVKSNLYEVLEMLRSDDEADDEDLFE
mgnify:CR=1 FL=1